MTSQPSDTASVFGQLATDRADPARIGEVAAETMQSIDGALSPIIGERGVLALYRRSLFLMLPAAPWLERVYRDTAVAGGYAALDAAIAQQSHADALESAEALFKTLHSLLASLIGDSLTERLLRTVFKPSSSGDAVQEVFP